MQPRFRLFAGPNGSGKTTLFQNLRKDGIIHTEIYVKADKIEWEIKATKKFHFNAYRIRVTEDGFKEHIISSGLFTSKIRDITIERVKLRAKQGLHSVSPDLIRSRYLRTFENLPLALKAADTAYVIDTSAVDVKIVAEKNKGRIVIKGPLAPVINPYLK